MESGKDHWLTSIEGSSNANGKISCKRAVSIPRGPSVSVISSLDEIGTDIDDFGSTNVETRRTEQKNKLFSLLQKKFLKKSYKD